MNKKILSLFCSGLMLFANAPCCAALEDVNQAQTKDFNKMNSSDSDNNVVGVDISTKKSDSDGENTEGVYISIDPITLKLNKELQPNGKFADGSSYTVDLTSGKLAIPLSLAYIDEQETEEMHIKFELIDDSSLISNMTDEEEKSKIIRLLKKLKGLKFQIESLDGNSTYLDCYINDCDKDSGRLEIPDSPDSSVGESKLQLQPMKNSEIDPTTGVGANTQKLNLTISTNSSATFSLTDLILILSELESKFYYRLQIQGAKVQS